MKTGQLVAYRTWKCRFCPEVRQDSGSMWDHLRNAHGFGCVQTGNNEMREIVQEEKDPVNIGINTGDDESP